MPVRVQLSRGKGYRKPPNTVSVARPTAFGNPFKARGDFTTAAAVQAFRDWLTTKSNFVPAQKAELLRRLPDLRGRNLACWCPLGSPCHADVLLELANAE